MLRVAQVFLAPFAVVVLQPSLAAHGQRDRVVGPQLDQLLGGFEELAGLTGLVVPLGQLLPAPVISGLESDEGLHLAAGERQVAAPGLDPCGPALQDHRRVVIEDRRHARPPWPRRIGPCPPAVRPSGRTPRGREG